MENNQEDRAAFAKFMKGLLKLHPKHDLDKDGIEIYFHALMEYPITTIRAAASAHLRDPELGYVFPLPTHFIRQIEKHLGKKEASVKERGEMQWAVILNELGRRGPYNPLELDDLQAMAAVKHIGGWAFLCEQDYDRLVWLKKEFMSAYDTYENAPRHSFPKALPGIVELKKLESQKQNKKALIRK